MEKKLTFRIVSKTRNCRESFFYHVVITVFFPAHSKYADVLNKYAKIRTKTNNAQDVRNRKKEKNQWQLKKKWGNFFQTEKKLRF